MIFLRLRRIGMPLALRIADSAYIHVEERVAAADVIVDVTGGIDAGLAIAFKGHQRRERAARACALWKVKVRPENRAVTDRDRNIGLLRDLVRRWRYGRRR